MTPTDKPTLLAVFAHPDDESFGIGGTLALYAKRGVKVHLVCATRGEAGEVKPEYLEGFTSIAERRVSELRCASCILGLSGVHFLDYRDSGMPGSTDNQHPQALINAPVEEIAAKVAHLMRQLQPQVVVTFDPIGGYKHPDHIAIHCAAVKAFEMAGNPAFVDGLAPFQPQKLYYNVFSKGFLRVAIWMLRLFGKDARHFGRNGDIDLVDLVESGSFPVHIKINYASVYEASQEAAACHASQLDGGMPRRGPLRWLIRLINGKDSFMRAYPPADKKTREKDLFDGVQ